ncbi:MAG: DUF5011 domain-containing protein [Lachnospiraceae bacterium]|jgi:hypothetical protein|nr:DUF5011 domain-containing protein [Lachnospiraceae bacterium]
MDNGNSYLGEYELVKREMKREAGLVGGHDRSKPQKALKRLAPAAFLLCVFAILIINTPVLELNRTLSVFTQAIAPPALDPATPPDEGGGATLASAETLPLDSFATAVVAVEVLTPESAPPDTLTVNVVTAKDWATGASNKQAPGPTETDAQAGAPDPDPATPDAKAKDAKETSAKTSKAKTKDNEAPTISGQLDKTVVQGGSLKYKSGVAVTDNADPEPTLKVDRSGVNLDVAGTYPVIYTATDKSGNSASVTGTVTVTAVDLDLVNGMADAILAQLITGGMSERDKAEAIFNWVVTKMKYSSKTNPRSLALGAYTCYTKGRGDCYVFFAGYHILLNRAGIKSERANRIDGVSEHYWNVVKIGGSWYHSDACTNKTIPAAERFLFTDSQAKSFSDRMLANGGRPHEAYKYDASAVPDIVD